VVHTLSSRTPASHGAGHQSDRKTRVSCPSSLMAALFAEKDFANKAALIYLGKRVAYIIMIYFTFFKDGKDIEINF
jgi:hypothetical protein